MNVIAARGFGLMTEEKRLHDIGLSDRRCRHRLDVFTRVVTDETRGFDHISAGYHGPLYAEISPRTAIFSGCRSLPETTACSPTQLTW
jgi:hypothetical protein